MQGGLWCECVNCSSRTRSRIRGLPSSTHLWSATYSFTYTKTAMHSVLHMATNIVPWRDGPSPRIPRMWQNNSNFSPRVRHPFLPKSTCQFWCYWCACIGGWVVELTPSACLAATSLLRIVTIERNTRIACRNGMMHVTVFLPRLSRPDHPAMTRLLLIEPQ